MQRFIPFPVFPDRAQALEEAWEDAWRRSCRYRAPDDPCTDAERFAGRFGALWDGDDDGSWRPALLLNGTHQETGKRIITSNLSITTDVFVDAFDFHHLVGHEVRVSTAVLNSARFPYVTPSGTLTNRSLPPDQSARGHILDGGYFENYGAETTRELAAHVLAALTGRQSGSEQQGRFVPIFIEIVSDPGLSDDDVERIGVTPPVGSANHYLAFSASNEVRAFANEFVAPLVGLVASQQGRGVFAAKSLTQFAAGIAPHGVVVAQFRLCPTTDSRSPPLGWAMAAATRQAIDASLSGEAEAEICACHDQNRRALVRILNAIGGV